MEIWEILGISPVRDKKQIKRAYAARAREIHPEEKPEEFRQLYEAYQEALRCAESLSCQIDGEGGSMPGVPEEAQGKNAETVEEPGKEKSGPGQDGSELLSYFEEQEKEREKKAALFLERWKGVKAEHSDPGVRMWWKDYLGSKDFQDIQWHPEFIKFLGEDMERQLSDDYTIRSFFWDAYGFQEYGEGDPLHQDDLRKLRRALYPAYERQKRWQNMQERTRYREREEKVRKILVGASWLIMGLFIFALIYCFLKRNGGVWVW